MKCINKLSLPVGGPSLTQSILGFINLICTVKILFRKHCCTELAGMRQKALAASEEGVSGRDEGGGVWGWK